MWTRIWNGVRRRLWPLCYVRVNDFVDRLDLARFDSSQFPPPQGLQIRRFDASTDRSIAESFSPQLFADFCHRAETAEGWILWDGIQACGYVWCTDRPRQNEGEPPFLYAVNPAADAVYLFDMQVLPVMRGRGAAGALLAAALEFAKARGKTSAVATRGNWNVKIHRVLQRLGFQVVGQLHYQRVLGWSRSDTRALYA